MHIITLSENEFDAACMRLAEKISLHKKPDVIVGVKNGGAIVAEAIYKIFLANGNGLKYYNVRASRNSSKAKKKYRLSYFFRFLPVMLLNLLRLIEHYYLKINMIFYTNHERNIKLTDDFRRDVGKLTKGCVFIIDDALDSGATISNLIEELNQLNPNLDYRSAVLVVTQNSPVISPDVYLYSNVLLRFPWSSDFKS